MVGSNLSNELENLHTIQSIDCQKFQNILTWLFYAISSNKSYIFLESEFTKLTDSLGFVKSSKEAKDFEINLEKLIDLFIEVAENNYNDESIIEKLQLSNFSERHIKVFLSQWNQNKKILIPVINGRSFAKHQLKGLAFELHGEVASTYTSRQRHPVAVMNLSISSESTSFPRVQLPQNEVSLTTKTKELICQMDFNELSEFFNKLEEIQLQIDNIK